MFFRIKLGIRNISFLESKFFLENENRKESRKEPLPNTHPPPLPKKVFFAFVLFLFIYKFIYFSLLNSAICQLTPTFARVDKTKSEKWNRSSSTFEQNVVSEELRQKIIYFC